MNIEYCFSTLVGGKCYAEFSRLIDKTIDPMNRSSDLKFVIKLHTVKVVDGDLV